SFMTPFMREAYQQWTNPEVIRSLDCKLSASLTNHVASRASIQQGRSLIQTACATYAPHSLLASRIKFMMKSSTAIRLSCTEFCVASWAYRRPKPRSPFFSALFGRWSPVQCGWAQPERSRDNEFSTNCKHGSQTLWKDKVEQFLVASLENVGSFMTPFMREAYQQWTNPEVIRSLDCKLSASLTNHVASRASIQQGRSLIQTACATYAAPQLVSLQDQIYDEELNGHQAVMYGVLCGFLGIPETQAAISFLFGTLRTMVASAVRLGTTGTLEGQRIQYKLQARIPDIVE
ncbi:hypothetical protein HPB47_019503, partial [Ixodes persulcatus]